MASFNNLFHVMAYLLFSCLKTKLIVKSTNSSKESIVTNVTGIQALSNSKITCREFFRDDVFFSVHNKLWFCDLGNWAHSLKPSARNKAVSDPICSSSHNIYGNNTARHITSAWNMSLGAAAAFLSQIRNGQNFCEMRRWILGRRILGIWWFLFIVTHTHTHIEKGRKVFRIIMLIQK